MSDCIRRGRFLATVTFIAVSGLLLLVSGSAQAMPERLSSGGQLAFPYGSDAQAIGGSPTGH